MSGSPAPSHGSVPEREGAKRTSRNGEPSLRDRLSRREYERSPSPAKDGKWRRNTRSDEYEPDWKYGRQPPTLERSKGGDVHGSGYRNEWPSRRQDSRYSRHDDGGPRWKPSRPRQRPKDDPWGPKYDRDPRSRADRSYAADKGKGLEEFEDALRRIRRLEKTPSDGEDEKERERRLQRLKRRRRSAGLDSESDGGSDHEAFAFASTSKADASPGSISSRPYRDHQAERRNDQDELAGSRNGGDKHSRNGRGPVADSLERRLDVDDARKKVPRTQPRDRYNDRSDRGWRSERNLSRPRRGRSRSLDEDRDRERRQESEEDEKISFRQRQHRNTGRTTDPAEMRSGRASRDDDLASSSRRQHRRDDSIRKRDSDARRSPGIRLLPRRRRSSEDESATKNHKFQNREELEDEGLSREGEQTTPASQDEQGQASKIGAVPEAGETTSAHLRSEEKAHSSLFNGKNVSLTRGRPDEIYERIAQVGEGTYGQVFKAKSDRTGVIVALKKIRMEGEKDGFPITAMREIKLLQGLRHENVVLLHEIMLSKHSVYMVFEYLQHDLNGILSQSAVVFEPAHLKSLAAQLLSGLAYLHQHSILHRDLKCSNLLLNNDGTLKLADFGLARTYTKRARAPQQRSLDYTNRVVTLWYRAPELLFGETSYSDAIDVWGAGCIFLELFIRRPVFPGNDEIHQIQLLYELLGPITSSKWPEAESLPWFDLVQPAIAGGASPESAQGLDEGSSRLSRHFSQLLPADAIDVAETLLTYSPHRRLSARDALSLPYFVRNDPPPQKPAAVLRAVEGEWHEFESRRAKRDAAAQALHAHVSRERLEERQQQRQLEERQHLNSQDISTATSHGASPLFAANEDGNASA